MQVVLLKPNSDELMRGPIIPVVLNNILLKQNRTYQGALNAVRERTISRNSVSVIHVQVCIGLTCAVHFLVRVK